jgi:hypothetical protein
MAVELDERDDYGEDRLVVLAISFKTYSSVFKMVQEKNGYVVARDIVADLGGTVQG